MICYRLIQACALACGLLSAATFAAPGTNNTAHPGFSGNVETLPPGRLKQQIQKLPPVAQQRALEWLERFNIPTADYDFLNADDDGVLFYTDTVLPDNADEAPPAASEPQSVAPADTFFLHSRPGASKVVFLDFDGHEISGTAWNSGSGAASTYYARPYDTDGAEQTFSDAERVKIAEIWHRVAEDMAAFDIDVTTEDPGSFGPETGHVLITSNNDATGEAMPYSNAGGVAYVGVWGDSYYTSYQPALVYYNNLGAGHPPYVSEAASHEFGHNLGLSHDGSTSSSYYSGHGSGYTSWAPIMGVGYYSNVTQWSKGEYNGANNQQDDLQIISSQLGYRADDHSNNIATATPLQVESDGTIYVTFPEIDPFNLQPANKGIIETSAETDLFWFDTAAGGITLNITPAWEAFYRSSLRGANLDLSVTLYDQQGNFVTGSDLQNDTRAQIDANLAAGRYYLEVTGVGSDASPYSDYGSQGMYFISGSVQPPLSDDSTAPTPDPMGWASVPAASDRTSIAMTAMTATDDSGLPVQYQFQCTTGSGAGCNDSGWQSSTYYLATGLTPSSSYSYKVKARDLAGNETSSVLALSATTDLNLAPQAQDDNSSTEQSTSVTIDVLNNDSDPEGDSLTIASFSTPNNGTVTQSGNNLVYTPDSGSTATDSFSYVVSDGFDSDTATVTVSVTTVNHPPVAADDSATVIVGNTVIIHVLDNDTDPEGNPLTIDAVGNPGKGNVSINDSTLVYTSTGKRGGDSFSYTISDINGNTASAVVNISISRDGGGNGGGDSGGPKCHPKRGC